MAKKITAPHSYDPGKGRPKEYLAYLNEREMAYLRSINGNNMERGPRGLPSFPPEDAVGSSSRSGSTKTTSNSGAGRDSSRGLGQGAGGSAIGKGPSGGGGLGGGGKGGSGSSPSSPGGLRGAGGNYGPGSGRPGTTSSTSGGYKGPASPMGGQGTSFSKDTRAQQEAQVRDAISAVKNSPAFRSDANSGGIRTLNVGPIGTPVNVGRPPSVPKTSYQSPTKPAPEGMFGPRSGIGTPSYIKAVSQPGFITSGMVSDYSGFPRVSYSGPDPTIGTYTGRENFDLSGSVPPENLSIGPDTINTEPTVFKEPEERILEIENVPDYTRVAAGTYTSPYDVRDSVSARNREKYVNALTPSAAGNPFQRVSGVGDVYDPNAQFSDQTKIPSNIQGSYPGGVRSIDVDEPKDEKFSGIESSGQIIREGEFEYPTNPDGSPITAEDLANMPEDIQKEYFDKKRYSRRQDTPYPLTKAEKEKGRAVGVLDKAKDFIPGVKAGLKVLSFLPGAVGEGAGKLSNIRESVNAYDRLDPLKKQQMRERSGKGRGFGGGSTSFTYPGGGKEDIGSGGKNEPIREKPVEEQISNAKQTPKESGRRPAIYYKWDLGVGVPSPTDSDYTLYLKYLQEKAAAKAGMAR